MAELEKPVLSPSLLQELADACPTGQIVTPAEVQSWLDLSWPLMRDYIEASRSKTPNVKRHILNWWKRVRVDEIEQARERLRVRERAAEDRRLDELAERLNDSEPSCGAEPARPLLQLVETRAGGGRR